MYRNQDPPTQSHTDFRHRANERVAGIYVLREPVGSGAFAEVWRASDTSMNREVALKLFYEDIMARRDLAKGVLREAESQARIANERVIAIYSCHLDPTTGPGPYYIAMRLMAGGTLDDLLEKQGRLPFQRAVSIAKDIAEGLRAAHEVDIVHRDIKPNNVLFDSKGRVALGDFGIAKDLRTNSGAKSVFSKPGVGTLHYMCPEQHLGKDVTKAWDIYSTGVLLYEMLAGKPPFDGPNDTAIYKAKVERPVPPLRIDVPNAPKRLQLVVERCLDPDLHSRYGDCDALIRALDWALQDDAGPIIPAKESSNARVQVDNESDSSQHTPATKAKLGPKPGDRVGNYVLDSLLGAGNLAEVWRARVEGAQTSVALKLFRGAYGRHSAVEEFSSALRLQSSIVDDRVVPVYSFDLPETPGSPRFVAMKLFTGGTLARLLEAKKQVPLADSLRIIRDMIDGLSSAHAVGLLHKNLRPSNVLFDSNARAALSDFCVVGELVHEVFARPDAADYLSPEQLGNEPVSPGSDIYSLGLILYEMLAGKQPFDRDKDTFPHSRLRTARLKPETSVARLTDLGVPERLDKVIFCCLDPDLEHRYADCATLSRALDWAAGPPPAPAPSSSPVEPLAPKIQVSKKSNGGRVLLVSLGIVIVIILFALSQGGH